MNSRKQNVDILVRAGLVAVASLILLLPAAARVLRIVIDRREPVAYQERVVGQAEAYKKLVRHAYGELDLKNP